MIVMQEPYPYQILPKKEFFHLMDVKTLLACYPNLAVSRRVSGNVEDAFVPFNGQKQLKDSLMGQVANMSLNLLGGLFDNEKHLRFCPKQNVEDWDGQDVDVRSLEGEYEIDACCFPIFFMAKDICDYPFTAPYYFQKEKDAEVFISSIPVGDIEKKYTDKFNKQEPIEVKTHAVLKHAPTNFNYWHCVLDSYPNLSSNDAIPTSNKGAAKRIIKMLRADLIRNFVKTDLAVDYSISRSYYA